MPKCAYINMVLNMPHILNRQSAEYGRVPNMRALHSVLNVPEYALTEFSIYLRF